MTAAAPQSHSSRVVRFLLGRIKPTNSDTAGKSPSEREHDRYTDFATLWSRLILIGLAVEVFGTVYLVSRLGRPVVDAAIDVGADILIFVGVWLEIRFENLARRAGDRVTAQAKERAAKFEKEAAEARAETERLKAQFSWRRLDVTAAKSLLDALANFPAGKVAFVHAVSDWESRNFANELSAAFSRLSWDVMYVSAAYSGDIIFGVRVPIDFGDERAGMARQIGEAFQKAGIQFIAGAAPAAFMTTPSKPTAGNVLRAVVYVGPKPPAG